MNATKAIDLFVELAADQQNFSCFSCGQPHPEQARACCGPTRVASYWSEAAMVRAMRHQSLSVNEIARALNRPTHEIWTTIGITKRYVESRTEDEARRIVRAEEAAARRKEREQARQLARTTLPCPTCQARVQLTPHKDVMMRRHGSRATMSGQASLACERCERVLWSGSGATPIDLAGAEFDEHDLFDHVFGHGAKCHSEVDIETVPRRNGWVRYAKLSFIVSCPGCGIEARKSWSFASPGGRAIVSRLAVLRRVGKEAHV